MKKITSAALILSSTLLVSTASHATIIQILQDNLQMNTQVYSQGTPGTSVNSSSYSGSVFGLPALPPGLGNDFSIASTGNIPCSSGGVGSQWATARTRSGDDSFFAEANSGYGQKCNEYNPWKNTSTINISLEFQVIPTDVAWFGNNSVMMYIEEFSSSFSLFDQTLGINIVPLSHGIGPHFQLLDEHIYTPEADVIREASKELLPYAYGENDEQYYYSYFNAIFANARIIPVPEPSTLVLFSLGFAGLLLTKRTRRTKHELT